MLKKNLKCYSARLNSLTPQRNLILQRRNSELTKKFEAGRGLRGGYHFFGCAAVANHLAAAWTWLAGAIPLSTVHSNSFQCFLLFCETHDLAWELISDSGFWKENVNLSEDQKISNFMCSENLKRQCFREKKNDEGGLFPLKKLLKKITHIRHFLQNIVNNFHNTVFHSLFRNTN